MKLKILILILTSTLIGGCGSSTSSDSNGSSSSTGTVVVKGSSGTTVSGSVAALVTSALADSVLIRIYRVSMATTADCEAAETNDSFIDVFDETSDTSDCVSSPTVTTASPGNFDDMIANPTFGQNDAFTAGTYACVRVTMCDQIVWTADLDGCPGINILDVSGDPTALVAAVNSFYWSTSGSLEEAQGEDRGTASLPFSIGTALTVTADVTNTFTMSMDNSESVGETTEGFYGRHDDEALTEAEVCEVPAPEMNFE